MTIETGGDDPARPQIARLPIVGVMGSGSHEHRALAAPLGRWLATLPVHLLTGGGSGVMLSVSRAFASVRPRRGMVVGVLPGTSEGASPRGYPNPYVELVIRTHLPLSGEEGGDPLSRNHVNVLSSDVVIALPGRAGTSSEVKLAVRYGRPVVAYLGADGEIPELIRGVEIARTLEEVQGFVGRVVGG